MGDFTLITEAMKTLSKCGRAVEPDGVSWADIPHGFLYQVTTPPGGTVTGNRFIDGDAPFVVRAIPATQDLSTYIRIQWPDGRFLSNALAPLDLNAWVGSYRRALTRDSVICMPGSNIRITTNNRTNAASNVSLLFEGVYRYSLKGGTGTPVQALGQLPRYWMAPNQNLMAPEMDLDLLMSEVPEGKIQLEYRMVSPTITIPETFTATVEIQIPTLYDFLLRRLVFDPPPGTMLMRAREASGYALCTDYAPVAQLANSPWAKNWLLPAGKSLFIDFVNPDGNGAQTFNVVAIGEQRRRAV